MYGEAFVPSSEPDGQRCKRPLQNSRPYNITHCGSNREIPEETAAAYEIAIEEGTYFIKMDILSSKDGFLKCFHNVTHVTTDIARHKEFADRKRTNDVQGVNTTGFFTYAILVYGHENFKSEFRGNVCDRSFLS